MSNLVASGKRHHDSLADNAIAAEIAAAVAVIVDAVLLPSAAVLDGALAAAPFAAVGAVVHESAVISAHAAADNFDSVAIGADAKVAAAEIVENAADSAGDAAAGAGGASYTELLVDSAVLWQQPMPHNRSG